MPGTMSLSCFRRNSRTEEVVDDVAGVKEQPDGLSEVGTFREALTISSLPAGSFSSRPNGLPDASLTELEVRFFRTCHLVRRSGKRSLRTAWPSEPMVMALGSGSSQVDGGPDARCPWPPSR